MRVCQNSIMSGGGKVEVRCIGRGRVCSVLEVITHLSRNKSCLELQVVTFLSHAYFYGKEIFPYFS